MSKFMWLLAALVVLVAGIIIYNKVLHPKDKAPTGPAGGPPKALAVTGFVVQPRNLDNNILASGTLLAFEEAELHPEVSGKITRLNLTEGSAVSKGTLLVKLYDADLQAQHKKLVLQKETQGTTLKRLKQLLAINGIGQQEYDDAQTTLNNIEADLELLDAQISKTEIRAPFNGVVGLKNVSMGSYVSPATVIATFQQIDPLKIDFTVPEKYSSTISRGDAVKFSVDGFEGMFTGKVFAIEPRVEEATRSIKVRAQVQNTNSKLFPGAFAKVDIGLKSISDALMVPTQCIIPDARNKKLIVVRSGKAEFVKVETGVRNESLIQIVSGIDAGDTVVTTALMYIKPGGQLKVVKVTDQ